MRILIDIGHPGHVHLFRPFAQEMEKKGHHILFTCRQKEFEIELLEAAEFKYISFGRHYKTTLGKIFGLFKFNIQMFFNAIKFKPDVLLSHGSIYAAHVSFLLKKPHVSMEDSGNMEQIRLYLPFTKVVLTPFELPENLGEKQIRYHSYHELAYLNPKYFIPNNKILRILGVSKNEKYAILRLVSWDATHDIGQGGLTVNQKEEIVGFLSSKMKLFITSEGNVPDYFKQYLIKIEPAQIHNVLSFADLVVSEGATMASEAGVLGTPTIYVNSLARCYNEDQEKYGTVFNFRDGTNVFEKVKELANGSLKQKENHKRILKDKINLTSFLVWFIENYPKSKLIMKKNPEYENRFKINNGLYSK